MDTATTTAPTAPKPLTLAQAGELLDVHGRTVGRWIAAGLIKAMPHGLKGLRIAPAEIERFRSARQRQLDARV